MESESTYLSDVQLAKRYDVRRGTIWKWKRERNDFPAPIKLSPGCTRWLLSDLEVWENRIKGKTNK